MNLLSEFTATAIFDNSKLKFKHIYVIENLSTYQLIEIDTKNISKIYYHKDYLNLIDVKNNFYKTYYNKDGFTLDNLFNLVLDFENNRIDKGIKELNNLEFNGLIWNSKNDGYQLLWN